MDANDAASSDPLKWKLSFGCKYHDVEVAESIKIHATITTPETYQANAPPAEGRAKATHARELPILLLHGNPQTHIIWRNIVPVLVESGYTVVAADLRGYGDSSKPADSEHGDHSQMSFRTMANDFVKVMEHFGFDRFFVCGHDRGARVAHRLAIDHPEKVAKLCVIDICPTQYMYKHADKDFATGYYHWFFLIQPFPMPERLIGAQRELYLRNRFEQHDKLAKNRRTQSESGHEKKAQESPFPPEIVDEYLRCFTPDMIHSVCEDYRASAAFDYDLDERDFDAGNHMACPLLALWGEFGFVEKTYDVLDVWRKYCKDPSQVSGRALPSGHYVPEECPEQVSKELLKFFETDE